MVVAFDIQAALDHLLHHFGAQVLIMVGRRDREVAFLVARPVAQIIFGAAGVPAAFFRIDVIETGIRRLIETDVIEDKELGFGAKVSGVGDARILQIHLGFLRDPSRIAVVVLPRDGIDDVGRHHDGFRFVERIEENSIGVRNQEHIALVDRRPPADTGAVDAEALFERGFLQLAHGI